MWEERSALNGCDWSVGMQGEGWVSGNKDTEQASDESVGSEGASRADDDANSGRQSESLLSS